MWGKKVGKKSGGKKNPNFFRGIVFVRRVFPYKMSNHNQRASLATHQAVVHAAPLGEEDAELYDDYYPQHYYENLSAVLTLAAERYPRVFVMNLATLTSEDPSQHQLETAHFPVGMDKNMRKLHRLVRRYNETIERVAKESGVPVIDLYSAFQNDEARLLMNDSCHVDAHGAELIAHTVLGEIEASLPAAGEYPARL